MSISPLNKSSILYENMLKNHFFSPFFIQSLIASKQQSIVQQGEFRIKQQTKDYSIRYS